jgi:hypothetical protein
MQVEEFQVLRTHLSQLQGKQQIECQIQRVIGNISHTRNRSHLLFKIRCNLIQTSQEEHTTALMKNLKKIMRSKDHSEETI